MLEIKEHITGIPELASAKKSWAKAQREHAAAALIDQGEEQRRLEQRCLQYGDTVTEEFKRVENLTGKVRTKKIKKKVAEMEELEGRMEKLSQPRIFRTKVTKKLDSDKSAASDNDRSNEHETFGKKDDEGNKSVAILNEASFGEMSDKHFHRIIKALGKVNTEEREIKMKHTSPTGSRHMTDKLYAKTLAINEKGSALLKCYGVGVNANVIQCRGHAKNDPDYLSGNSKIDVERTENPGRRLTKFERKRLPVLAFKSELHEGVIANASSALDAAEAALHGLMGGSKEEDEEGQRPISRAEIQKLEETIEETYNASQSIEPFEKYEIGKIPFFDRSSSTQKGRFRVRDAREFAPESMRRKPDTEQGIMFLVGEKIGGGTEFTITIMFDRSLFTEHAASVWWRLNKKRFVPTVSDCT